MMQSTKTIQVRYNECDPMGIAHHAVYPVWLEIGRTELLREQGELYKKLEANGYFFVVTDLHVQYIRPAKYDDTITIVTSLQKSTAVRLIHNYEIFRDELCITKATTTLACINSQGEAQRLPDEIFI
tara:strand:+ start:1641 stop:2021 length:381 start_codon:yes stop_codon:yes gene_type:complete